MWGGVAEVVEHHHVGVEAGERLHHADLPVGERDEAPVHQAVGGGVAGGAVHDIRLLLLVREGDGGHHVRAEVDAEDEHGGEGQGQLHHDEAEEGADLGDVGGERVGDGLLEVIEDEAALLHAVDDGGEVVIHEDHVGRLLGDVLAGDAHGHADVTLLERGGVVDAVARHGHDLAAALRVLHNEELVGGGHAGPHDLLVREGGVPLGHLLLLVSDVHPVADGVAVDNGRLAGVPLLLVDDSNGLGDGLRGDGVVARHHEHLDARALALGNSLGHALAGGVDEGEEAGEGEPVGLEVGGGLGLVHKVGALGHVLEGEPEHALAQGAEALVGGVVGGHPGVVDGLLHAVVEVVLALEDHALGGALHHEHGGVAVLGLVDRELPLVGGVELDLEKLGALQAVLAHRADGVHGLGEAGLGGIGGAVEREEIEVGVLHGLVKVDVLRGVLNVGGQEVSVVAQGAHHLELLERGVVDVVPRLGAGLHAQEASQVASVLGGRGAVDGAVVPAVLHGHAVLGERAGLVRGDHGGGAQGLDGLEVLDKHVLGVHALGREGEGHSHRGEEALGHVGHDDADGKHHVLDDGGADDDADDKEDHAEGDGHRGDKGDELLDLLGDGGILVGGLGGEAGDLAHNGAVAAADDAAAGLASLHDGRVEDKVGGLEGLGDGVAVAVKVEVGATLLGLRLARERGVVDLELVGSHDADVSGHLVAIAKVDNVAGHKVNGINDHLRAVADDLALLGDHVLEPLHDLVGLGLLDVGESRRDEHHNHEHHAEVQVGGIRLVEGIADEA
mmetsp:Transcript_12653/g.39934  ORF Transcript_12653/g.39934 Transcript_12653/m.39934 type:complete len:787 (+) Transcript_12653:1142-3502(+)